METTLRTAKDFREYFSKGDEQLNSIIEEYLRAATDDDLERLVKSLKGHMFSHPAIDVSILFLIEIQILKDITMQFIDSESIGEWYHLGDINQEDKLFLLDKIQEIL